MKRILAFAAIVASALAGQEDGGAAFSVPSYTTAGAPASSYVAAPAMLSATSSMSKPTSSVAWQAWSGTAAMATSTALKPSSSMAASPSLMMMTSVAMPKSTGWPSSPMATHTVMVGGSSLVYTPPSLSGVKHKDTIIFLFLQVNHTLTQSSFTSPCMKVEGGFESGFLPSNGTFIPFIIVEFIDIMSTGSPLWFYCGQADHCERGMRFSINALGDNDMAWRALDTLSSTATSSMKMTMSTSSMKMTMSTSSMKMTMSTTSSATKAMATASVIPGTGTIMNGQCMCDCFCGFNAFPTGVGIGMMGGLPGMIPAASGPSMAGAMSSNMAYPSVSGGWK